MTPAETGPAAARIDYTIERLGAADVDAMRALMACFADAFDDPKAYLEAEPSDAYLRGLLADESFVALVARAGGLVVGGLTAYELRKPEQERSECYVYDLAVEEAFRRQGIATALIEAMKPIARSQGAWVVFLQADLGDDPAIAVYSRLGVREDVIQFDIPLD